MTKKLLLVFGTLVVLILAIGVYRQYSNDPLYGPQPMPLKGLEKEPFPGISGNDSRRGGSERMWYAQTDPVTGRREAVYEAASGVNTDDTYKLVEPKITLYYKKGQTVRITADEGVIVADDIGGNFVARQSTLSGNVHVEIDMSKRGDPTDSDAGSMHIHMEDMLYHSDLQEITTRRSVTLESPQARIVGSDMSLRWDTSPDWEIRSLKLRHGEFMEIYAGAAGFDQLKGGKTEPTATTTQPATRAATQPGESAQGAEIRRYAVTLHDDVVVDADTQCLRGADTLRLLFAAARSSDDMDSSEKARPASTPQAKAAPSQPATQPKPKAVEPPAEPIRITWSGALELKPVARATADAEDLENLSAVGDYLIRADGDDLQLTSKEIDAACNQLVYCGRTKTGRLKAAAGEDVLLTLGVEGDQVSCPEVELDHLQHEVRLKGQGRIAMVDAGESLLPAVSDEDDAPGPVTGWVEPTRVVRAVVPAAWPSMLPTAMATPATLGASVQLATMSVATITWADSGRLTYSVEPGVDDGRSSMRPVMAEFRGDVYFRDGSDRSLAADELDLEFGQPVIADTTATQPATQPASRPASRPVVKVAAGPVAGPASQPATAPATKPAEQAAVKIAATPAKDNDRFGDVDVKRMVARGSVKHANGRTGDFVHADELEVTMTRTAAGKVIPETATSTGNAWARQGTESVKAQKLTLSFEPVQRSDGRMSVEPGELTAEGEVDFESVEADGTIVRALGDTVTGYPRVGGYEITGEPDAKLFYGGDWIAGKLITIEAVDKADDGGDAAESESTKVDRVAIVGSGKARFLLHEDISGKKLAMARPAYIRWSEGVTFGEEKDVLKFTGDVRLDSADGLDEPGLENLTFDSVGDHVRCEVMSVTLTPSDDAAGDEAQSAATQPATTQPATTQPAGKEASSAFSRKIASLKAEEKVRLLRRWHDGEGYLTSRMQLSCDEIDFFGAGRDELEVTGAGTMVVEDYRPEKPKPAKPASVRRRRRSVDPMVDRQGDRPSQTVFKWTERMQLLQSVWTSSADQAVKRPLWIATMDGQVAMRRRSGSQVRGLDALGVRPGLASTAGRTTELDCEHMEAQFIRNEKAGEESADGGLAVDLNLHLFEATGAVVFKDDGAEAHGGRMVYNRGEGVAVVYGDDTSGSAEEDDDVEKILRHASHARKDARVVYSKPGRRRQRFQKVAPVIVLKNCGPDHYEVHVAKGRGSTR